MTFKEKLVILRKSKGLTQDEFASAVGVSRQAVYKWESGQSYPEVPKLLEMKLLFTISIDELLDDSYDIPVPEKKRKKRISKETMRQIEESVEKQIKAPKPAAPKPAAPKPASPKVVEAPKVAEAPKAEVKPEPVVVAPKAQEPVIVVAPKVEPKAEPEAVKISTVDYVPEFKPASAEIPMPQVTEHPIVLSDDDDFVEEEEPVKKGGLFGRLFGRK